MSNQGKLLFKNMANRGDIKSIWGYGGGVYSRKDDFHGTFFAEIGMSFYDQ